MMNFIVIDEEKMNAIIEKIDCVQKTLTKQENSRSPQKQWLTTKEAADFLNVTTRSIQNYRDRGLLSYSTFGGKILFFFDDLQNFLLEHRIGSITKRKGR